MAQKELDPVYRNARREAIVILGVYVAALIYTVTYCYIFGYDRDVATITTYWGIPDWVCWGIFLPWTICSIITAWFVLFFMKDDDLDHDPWDDQPNSTHPSRMTSSDEHESDAG